MTSRTRILCIVIGAAVTAAIAMASRGAAPPMPLTAQSLSASFDAGIRNVVVQWDPQDPRTADERRAALMTFVYETYDASAWIPQSLFDSNLITQAVAGNVDTIISERAGLVRWRDNPVVPAFGMAPNASSGAPLRWTVNCLMCHTAEIDGVTYFGAGTKTFDDVWLGEALKQLTNEPWRGRLRGTHDYDVTAQANRILNSHHHDKIDSLTRGRSTAFAASHVEFFMRQHANQMPPAAVVGRGDVKTPPLWHTAAKLPVGRWYTDGSFHGRLPLMASSMELEKDRPFDALVEVVVPRIKDEFDSVVTHLRPPRYPYAIDRGLAERGRALFESRALGCASCHGTYDGYGNVDWPGVHRDVGTDRGRRDLVSEGFVEAFDRSPLAAEGSLRKSHGYAATPLTGVWANFPYLHNGSVPTLYDLLGPVSERPRIFEVMAARTLDRERVGQPLARNRTDLEISEEERLRRHGQDRDWFNTARPGSSNTGHDFWRYIGTNENRRALIEYLKTL